MPFGGPASSLQRISSERPKGFSQVFIFGIAGGGVGMLPARFPRGLDPVLHIDLELIRAHAGKRGSKDLKRASVDTVFRHTTSTTLVSA